MITSVRLETGGVAIEGEFELPPLARLRYEDQVFVSEFVRSHGSIKDMEKAFGVSYPTVKNRLNRIADQLSWCRYAARPRRPTDDDVLDHARARRDLGRRGRGEAAALMLPPMLLYLRVGTPDAPGRGLWLPLFLLWLMLLPLVVLVLLVRDRSSTSCCSSPGERYHHYTLLLVRCFGVLGATRGTAVRIRCERERPSTCGP